MNQYSSYYLSYILTHFLVFEIKKESLEISIFSKNLDLNYKYFLYTQNYAEKYKDVLTKL